MVGKPKGSPKTGGRTKGTTNKLTETHKDLIAASSPIEFLIHAFTNGCIEGTTNPTEEDTDKYLTLTYKERCDIARDLAKKIVPDLKAIDHGEMGHKITFIMQSAIAYAPNTKPDVTNGAKNSNDSTES